VRRKRGRYAIALIVIVPVNQFIPSVGDVAPLLRYAIGVVRSSAKRLPSAQDAWQRWIERELQFFTSHFPRKL